MQKDNLVELFIKKNQQIKDLEKQVYLDNLFAFNKEVLQIEQGTDEGRPRALLRPFQENLCKFVEDKNNHRQLILMPRGHLKSTLITVGYSLQRIAENPNVRILIGNATSTMAESFLSQVKHHIEFNKRFIELYGDMKPTASTWSQNMITIKTAAESFKEKEATVTAYGLGGSLVSQHYDLIIWDDPHNLENINTKDQIEKVKEQVKYSLDLLEPNGKLIIIGTRWHDDDLYGSILDPENHMGRSYKVFFQQALAGPKILRKPEGGYEIIEGEVLWPEKYNLKTLTGLLNDKGLYQFSCQYQNTPVDDEMAVFHKTWFKYYDQSEVKHRDLAKFTAIDPAISQKQRADYTAIVTVGVDILGLIYVLEIKRGHYTESEMSDEIFRTCEEWHPRKVVIETIAFQKTLQKFLQDEMRKRQMPIPIEEVMPESGESKEKRIRSLQPRYMGGKILHTTGILNTEYLEDELLRFPKGKNDDIIDSLAYAISVSFTPKSHKRKHNSKKYLY